MRGRIPSAVGAKRTRDALGTALAARAGRTVLATLATLAFALVLSLFTGCTTLAGWVGIASEKSVDESLGAARRDLETEIAGLRGDMEQVQEQVVRIERLGALFEETMQATEELQQLAKVMESRLEKTPRDTIEKLVDILQDYLEATE